MTSSSTSFEKKLKVIIVFRHPRDFSLKATPDNPEPKMKIVSLVHQIPDYHNHGKPETYAAFVTNKHKQEFAAKLVEYKFVDFTYEIHELVIGEMLAPAS